MLQLFFFHQKRCQNLGGHLISIHSFNEYQLIKALIRAHDPQENLTWIGLNGCQKVNKSLTGLNEISDQIIMKLYSAWFIDINMAKWRTSQQILHTVMYF